MGTPLTIDWKEVFVDGDPDADDDDADVCFSTSSTTPTAPPARPGKKQQQQQQLKGDATGPRHRHHKRFGALHRGRGGGLGQGQGQRNLLALLQPRAGPDKAADDTGHGAARTSASAFEVYEFGAEDAEGERASRKFSVTESLVQSAKKNWGQLETNSRGRPRHVGVGERKPVPVDKMYSGKPCSAFLVGHQQRVHAFDPEEFDREEFRWSQNCSFSKRRKEEHRGSSSRYIQKVENVVLLDDEEMQPDEKVDCGTPDKQIESKIYYPSRDDPQAVELSSSDIRCLEPGVYLSSPVINYYIQYIKRSKLPKEDKFYIFNTYFYSKLEEALAQKSDFFKLRRWWKGVSIFQRAYIILPIHGMAHWSLIIICIPGKESDSGPIIIHLDSLGMHSSTNIFGTIKRYLEEEWSYLKKNPPPGMSISESVWEDLPRNIHTQIVEVPQQNNAYDCGIFMLYYMERFVREAPERFTRDNLGMFSRSWFNSEDASELRGRIRSLLLEEFESAMLDDAISDVASSDGSDKEDIIMGGDSEAVTPSYCSETAIERVEAGDGIENDEGFKIAGAEGSGESGGTNKCGTGIAEVPALDEAHNGSIRHDETGDCVLLEAATFSGSINDEEEDPAEVCSDSTKAGGEEEEELAIVSRDIVYDSCDSDPDDVMIVRVRERRATRQNCLII